MAVPKRKTSSAIKPAINKNAKDGINIINKKDITTVATTNPTFFNIVVPFAGLFTKCSVKNSLIIVRQPPMYFYYCNTQKGLLTSPF